MFSRDRERSRNVRISSYNSGRNRTRVNFYDANIFDEEKNDYGEWEQKPKVIYTAWVEVIPLTGRQYLENRKNEHEMNFKIKMRATDKINEEMWCEINGKKADIIFVSPGVGGYMELIANWQS